jgi:hypothetical protein
MTYTFTTPAGAQVRTKTVRRYVLIRETPGPAAEVVKRSDNPGVLAAERRRAGIHAGHAWYRGDTYDLTLTALNGNGSDAGRAYSAATRTVKRGGPSGGKMLGEMSPADRAATIAGAADRLQAELQAAAPAIAKILDERGA